MARLKKNSGWITIPKSLEGLGRGSELKFGPKESICGERCPHPDWPDCGTKSSRSCEFYKQELEKLRQKSKNKNST